MIQSRLFKSPNAPYYVYAPTYRENSGGARALHYLCHALNLVGEEAYITDTGSPSLRTPTLTKEIAQRHAEQGLSPIVVYPEVITGNPLGAKNVVRYLLNVPGLLTGEQIRWEPTDMVYTHGVDVVPADMHANLLKIPLSDTRIFNAVGTSNDGRRGTLLVLNRYLQHGGTLDPVTANSTEISFRVPNRSLAELAALYRTAELLYTHEPSTACYEALLCGCPVVYLPNDILLPKKMLGYLGNAGSAWGNSPDQIAYAKRTVHEIPAIYNQVEQEFWRQLDSFIDATQRRAMGTTISPTSSRSQTVAPTFQLPQKNRKKRILIYSVESTWSPCPQIRLIRPFMQLGDEWEIEWGIKNGKLDANAASHADLILLHRFTPGLLPLSALEIIFKLGKPVIYESDDLLNEIPADHPEAAAGASWKEGIEYSVKHANAVVVSTHFLAEKYRSINPNVHVLQNYLDYDIFHRSVPFKSPNESIRIGLLGSSIQPSNFALVEHALRTICDKYGDRIHIDFVGWECPKGWENHPQAHFTSFIHEYEKYAAQLQDMAWDIALIPLAQDAYNQCKSYIKWLDYSAAGIASIFSNVSVYNAVVTNSATGLLMPNSHEAWLDAITSLIDSPEKRYRLALAAQQEVREKFSLKKNVSLYNSVYSSFLPTTVEMPPAVPPKVDMSLQKPLSRVQSRLTTVARSTLAKRQ